MGLKRRTGELSKRYAKALFRAAQAKNFEKDAVLEALSFVEELFAYKEISFVLENPVIASTLNQELFEYALNSWQDTSDDPQAKEIGIHCGKLLLQMDSQGRVSDILAMISSFRELLDRDRKIYRGQLITAVKLADSEQQEIEKTICKTLERDILFQVDIDPEILGGFVATIGHTKIDASTRTRLLELTR